MRTEFVGLYIGYWLVIVRYESEILEVKEVYLNHEG